MHDAQARLEAHPPTIEPTAVDDDHGLARTRLRWADNLQGVRLARGLTQRQLAALIGVEGKTLSAWEAARSTPPLERCLQLAHVLDIAAADLFPYPDEVVA